jgi:hypothetical protein
MKFDERNPNSFLNPPFFVSMVLVPSGLICMSPFLPVISAVFSSGVSGHGTDFNQEGAQSLADKVKILQQTYAVFSSGVSL